MAMEVDQDDVLEDVATSPSVSAPAVISTQLGFNTSLAASGGPFLPAGYPFHPGGGCYPNVGASPSSSYYSVAASPFPCLLPLAAGPSLRAICLGPSSAAPVPWTGGTAGTSVGPEERRKKRMIKNRESASRARARKHTHASRIESEVKELREGNEQLRIKYAKLKAEVQVSVPVKKTLQRMLSAPF